MAEEDKDAARETEDGTVIGPDHVAVVVSPDGAWQILVPKDEDAELPQQATALIAAAMRLTSDSQFYKEMVEWFAEHHGAPDEEESH